MIPFVFNRWPPPGDPFFSLAGRAMNKWLSLGASKRVGFGLLGNHERECAFKVVEVGDKQMAFGLGQWWWAARGSVILEKTGIDVRTEPMIEKHVEAAFFELTHVFPKVWEAVLAVPTTADAGRLLCTKWEIAGAPGADDTSAAYAERWLLFDATTPDWLKNNPSQI